MFAIIPKFGEIILGTPNFGEVKTKVVGGIGTFLTMSGTTYSRDMFVFQDGDIDRWREEVRQLSTVFVEGVKVPGNRRVTGKLSVFTNEDLVHLILLYATPRTFNYRKEDLPYTLLLNPFPLKSLDFFDSVTSLEKEKSPLLDGVSKIFRYQTGRYFSEYLSTSFVAIAAVDFLKYAFKSILLGADDKGDCTIGMVVLSFWENAGLIVHPNSFRHYFFKTMEDQVSLVHHALETPSFVAVFVKTSTQGWAVEHFFAHSGLWVYEGEEDDVLESNVRIVSNEEFRTMEHL